MAGTLAYKLTLDGGSFDSVVTRAITRIGGLTAGFIGLREIVDRVWQQIERGGALVDLSNRTGAAVGDLYQLQEAFSIVGIGAESVGPIILRLQRSISGFGAAGENTAAIFGSIGLNIQELQRLNAPEQLSRIAEALNKIPDSQRVAVSAGIFGREGAGNIVQLSRDLEGFNDTLKQTRTEAALFALNANAFDKLGDTITRAKGAFNGLFAGIAEQITPLLQRLADTAQFDWIGLGRGIGTFIRAAFGAFESGNLSLMIADSIRLGFETAVDFIPGIFEKLGAMVFKVFQGPLVLIQSYIDWQIQRLAQLGSVLGNLNNPVALGANLLAASQSTANFAEIFAKNKATGPQFDFGSGQFGIEDINNDANKRLSVASEAFRERWKEFWGKIEDYAGTIPLDQTTLATKAKGVGDTFTGAAGKVEASSLEKLGFILSGSRSFDPALRTANNTERIAVATETLAKNSNPVGRTNSGFVNLP